MHDEVRGTSNRERSWWSFGDDSNDYRLVPAGIILGVLIGGAIGLLVEGATMMAVGISMGSGVGWGLARQYVTARRQGGSALLGMAGGGIAGGIVGGLLGALTGWDIFIMLGIALGVALGANIGQRLGESQSIAK